MCLLKIATPFLTYWNCSHLEITLMLVVEMVFFFFVSQTIQVEEQ